MEVTSQRSVDDVSISRLDHLPNRDLKDAKIWRYFATFVGLCWKAYCEGKYGKLEAVGGSSGRICYHRAPYAFVYSQSEETLSPAKVDLQDSLPSCFAAPLRSYH